MRRVSLRQRPEWNTDGKKAANVNEQDDSLNQGQLLCEDGVEHIGAKYGSKHQQGRMPPLEDISVRVVQNNQALYAAANQKRNGPYSGLPSCEAEPTCKASINAQQCRGAVVPLR
jgi:hypothetical protein